MFIMVVLEINDDRLVTRSSKNCFLPRVRSISPVSPPKRGICCVYKHGTLESGECPSTVIDIGHVHLVLVFFGREADMTLFSFVFGYIIAPYSRLHEFPSLIAPPSVYVRPVGFMDVAHDMDPRAQVGETVEEGVTAYERALGRPIENAERWSMRESAKR